MRTVKKCKRRMVKKCKLPLHFLESTYKLDPSHYETIPAVGRNPVQVGKEPFQVFILCSKEGFKTVDGQAPKHVKIYMDGLVHNGRVGAAAVMIKDGKTID